MTVQGGRRTPHKRRPAATLEHDMLHNTRLNQNWVLRSAFTTAVCGISAGLKKKILKSISTRYGTSQQRSGSVAGLGSHCLSFCVLSVFGTGLIPVPHESPRARLLTRGRGSHARCATSLVLKASKCINMRLLCVADVVPAS